MTAPPFDSTDPAGEAQDLALPAPSASDALRRRAFLPILGALALLLTICGAAAYLGIESQRQAKQALHEEAVDSAAASLRARLLAAGSAERGFLMTGDADLQRAFAASLPPVGSALQHLDQSLGGNALRQDIARLLRQDVQARLATMTATLARAREAGTEAARAREQAAKDQQANERIEAAIGALERDVTDARLRATRLQARSIEWLMVAIGMAAAGALLLAALALRDVRRHVHLLRQRETQLARLVDSLEARVARRTRALEEANQRFQIALDSARVTVFSQLRDLTYSWISQKFRGLEPSQIIGAQDAEIMPADTAARLDEIKRGVISTGQPARLEIRIEGDAAPSWYEISLVATRGEDGAVDGLVGGAADISDRKNYESHVRLLMREVTHRSKNLLAVVQALMRQTASRAGSIEEFSRSFSARLDSLAGAYDLLIKDDWRGTTMDQLVHAQLARFLPTQAGQIDISGPTVNVPPDATQNIGMALHELATNAARYGALSVPAGRVQVHWHIEGDAPGEPACRIWWRETGGPPVRKPERSGFGQIVIERTVARAVGGRVTLAYNPEGIEWMLVFPLKA